jgi:hypothetical protein
MNGAQTGMGITQPVQRLILSALRLAPPASSAVVPGSSRRTTPVPRFGTGTSPPSATSSWASASVSDRPASSGVRRREQEGPRRSRGRASDRDRAERRFFFALPRLPQFGPLWGKYEISLLHSVKWVIRMKTKSNRSPAHSRGEQEAVLQGLRLFRQGERVRPEHGGAGDAETRWREPTVPHATFSMQQVQLIVCFFLSAN